MKHLLAIALLILPLPVWGQTMPHVLTPELRAKWPELSKAGNPWTTYGEWSLTADPSWFAGRSVTSCYMAWLSTGEQKYLDLATDDYLLMPDVTAGQAIGHLYEIYHVRDYLILKPHLTPERQAEWQRRLKALGEKMTGGVRIGDIDQCETYVAYWRILDKFCCGDFLKRPAMQEVAKWVDEFYAPDTFKGGPRDASSFYEQSTASLRCQAASIYGKDIFPWFDVWAKEHAKWLPMSVSSDYKDAAAWGDQQGDDGGKVLNYHRVQLCFLLSGLGYDEDGALISLGRKMMGTPTMGSPLSVYPYGAMGFTLVCDPERIMSAPDVPLKDFFHVAEGIGTTVLREGPNWLYTNFPASVRFNGSTIPTEDHHYSGHFADPTWKYKGVHIVTQPRGYGFGAHDGANEFHSSNSVAMKCDGWFWMRRFLGASQTATGFTSSGEMFGPSERYQHPIAPDGWPGMNAYDKCKIVSRIDFDREAPVLTVADKWLTPGDTFPSWTTDLPVFQRCQHALGKITDDGTALTWEVGGIPVRCAYKLTDGEGNAVKPTVVVESEPRYLNSQNYWRAFIQSPPDLLNGAIELRIGPVVEPVPGPPPSTDVEVRGVIRTVNGKRELVVPLP
jgi:hypothetical protein